MPLTSDLRIRILDIVEGYTVNAVARNVFTFHSSAATMPPGWPKIERSLLTFDRGAKPRASPNDLVSAARALSLQVDVIHERFRFDPRVIPALRAAVMSRGPHIIVTHHVKGHFLLRLSRLSRRYHWVAFHHGYTTTDLTMRLYNLLDRWSLPRANRVITVCKAFAEELAGKGVPIGRISVQHNSIGPRPPAAPEEVQALRSRLGVTDACCAVLAVGRLSREKGHVDLVSAFDRLRQDRPELSLKLVIVGDGPERGRLEATIRSLRMNEHVVLSGYRNDVQTFYGMARVLALPSHSEGSSNVLLEAMAARVPIVATAVGGVPEMLRDGESALLVPARDPSAMAAAVARLLLDERLARRLATGAGALVTTHHLPEVYARNLALIYREVLNT
jgi:glycosyltransferase involved in cell wall biosynthesis